MKNKEKRLEKIYTGLALICLAVFLLAAGIYLFSGIHGSSPTCNLDSTSIIFSDPNAKLAELSSENFTMRLFVEAFASEPLLNQSGTQVSMGFWSGKGNHGSLVRLLDDINGYSYPPNETQRAIWDEGVQSSLQYPEYVMMNAREVWYARSSNVNGSVTIYGVKYADPYNISFSQADAIWGEYSQRYADMARLIKQGTGKSVKVWCFVQGARQNRIFYVYEYPELQKLEQEGIIEVYFAKTQDANWLNPDDWYYGTANISNAGIQN